MRMLRYERRKRGMPAPMIDKRPTIFLSGNNHPYLSTLSSIGADGSPTIFYWGEYSSSRFATAPLQKLFARHVHITDAGKTIAGLL